MTICFVLLFHIPNKMEKEENTAAATTKTEETKDESKSETKEVSFPKFVYKSFECLFNQNKVLHEALHAYLEKQIKEHNEKMQLKFENLQQELHQQYLTYTRDILDGLQEANEDLIKQLNNMKAAEKL